MKGKGFKLIAVLITMLACTFVVSMANAAIVQLDAIDSGWYRDNGNHSAGNNNYLVGDNSGSVYHNFFVFDLSGITDPIDAATLSVFNPSVAFGGADGYNSADPTETWTLWMVSSSITDLTATHAAGDPIGIDIYNDLGGTISFGSRVCSAADNGMLITVPLNADGLADLNYYRGSQWAIGGSLTTLDTVANNELVFSNSDTGPMTRRLTLTICEYGNGQVCYSYCPIGSCPPSYCTVNVPGMAPGCMNIGQIAYCGCAPGSCAPSQCIIYIPTP